MIKQLTNKVLSARQLLTSCQVDDRGLLPVTWQRSLWDPNGKTATQVIQKKATWASQKIALCALLKTQQRCILCCCLWAQQNSDVLGRRHQPLPRTSWLAAQHTHTHLPASMHTRSCGFCRCIQEWETVTMIKVYTGAHRHLIRLLATQMPICVGHRHRSVSTALRCLTGAKTPNKSSLAMTHESSEGQGFGGGRWGSVDVSPSSISLISHLHRWLDRQPK